MTNNDLFLTEDIRSMLPNLRFDPDYLGMVIKFDHEFEVDYDEWTDFLYISVGGFVTLDGAVVHYMNDRVGLLYDPETYDVVGLQIEAFKHFGGILHAQFTAMAVKGTSSVAEVEISLPLFPMGIEIPLSVKLKLNGKLNGSGAVAMNDGNSEGEG